MPTRNRILVLLVVLAGILGLSACSGSNDADVASENISTAADNFEVTRQIVFINGITDEKLLTIEGRCSINDDGNQLEVTCKIADGDGASSYLKHFLGLSDNVTYVAEQMEGIDVSVYHYRRTFKPEAIIPDIDLRVESEEEN